MLPFGIGTGASFLRDLFIAKADGLGPLGSRYSVQCGTEEDARDTAGEIRKEIRQGRFDIEALKARIAADKQEEKPTVPTLREFYEQTMTPLWEATCSPATVARYATDFKHHILPVFGESHLNELTRDALKDFTVSLRHKSARKRTHGEEKQEKEAERKLAKDSIRNIIAALRSCLNEALDKGLIVTNVADRLGKLYREAGKRREEADPFLREEMPLLLDATLKHFGMTTTSRCCACSIRA